MPGALPEPLLEIIRDATSRRKRPWLLVALGFILVCTAWKAKLGAPRPPGSTPDSIEYHYSQWLHHKDNFLGGTHTNHLTKKIIRHLVGNLTDAERSKKIEEHETALIRLGYFEWRRFDFKGSDVNKMISQFTKNAMQTDLKHYWTVYSVYGAGKKTNICFIAREQDFITIEYIFKRLDNASTNP